MLLLGHNFSDIYHTLNDSCSDLSDLEDFSKPSSRVTTTVAVRLGSVSSKAEESNGISPSRKKQNWPPKSYKISKYNFGNATLTDILFTDARSFSIEIPNDANVLWTVFFLKRFLTEKTIHDLTLETNLYGSFAVSMCCFCCSCCQ